MRAQRLLTLRSLHATYVALPIDERVASAFAELVATARRADRRLKVQDAWIAATARAHAAALLHAGFGLRRPCRCRSRSRLSGDPAAGTAAARPLCCRPDGRDAAWMVLAAVLLAAAALKAADRTGTTVALSAYGVPGRLAAPAFAALVVARGRAGRVPRGRGRGRALRGRARARRLPRRAGRRARPGQRGRAVRLLRRRRAALARRGRPHRAAGMRVRGAAAAGRRAERAAGADRRGRGGRRRARGGAPQRAARSARDRRRGAAAGRAEPAGRVVRGRAGGDVRLALFTSPGCALCRRIAPAADALDGVAVRRFDEAEDTDAWAAARVPGAPFAVALGPGGVVLAKGTVNDGAPARIDRRRRAGAARAAARARRGARSSAAPAESPRRRPAPAWSAR